VRPGPFRKIACALVAALLAAAILAAIVDIAPTATRAAPAKVEALLLGDSVLNGLAQPYSASGRAALAARHSFILDSAGCRRLITTSCRIPPDPAPNNAITALRSHAGQYESVLVVAAGYNDSPNGPSGVGAAIDVMLTEARRQGISRVIWLTYREAGGATIAAQLRQSNAILRSRTDPELVIADWASRSATMPSSWFSADGIHLGSQAAAAIGDLIGDTLDRVVQTRCTSGEWSGTEVPAGVADTVATTGGLNVMPAPVRAVDTRNLPGKLGAGRMLTVPIAGANGVPADATAALVSLTAVEPCSVTFLTAFPCGSTLPLASVVNANALSTVANSAVVRLGGGALCVYTSQPTDVLVDVSGWIGPAGLESTPLAPLRLVDTRPGQQQALSVPQERLGAGGALTVDLSPLAGSDPNGAAASVNVTAAGPAGDGFVSVLPGPCAGVVLPPTTSNLNVSTGRNAAASATIALGNGQLCVYSSTATDVVVDLQALHGAAGGLVTAVDPRRILDTRNSSRLSPGQSLPIELGFASAAVIVNLTAVDSSASGFVTLYPCGAALPTVSNLNVDAGAVVANRALVSTAGTNRFCVYSSVETDVVIDIEAFVTRN
jgi:hypothetical protein